MTLAPSASNTASKEAVNFVSPSRIKKHRSDTELAEVGGDVPPLLRHPGAVRVLRRSGHVHPPGSQFEEEQHVIRLEGEPSRR